MDNSISTPFRDRATKVDNDWTALNLTMLPYMYLALSIKCYFCTQKLCVWLKSTSMGWNDHTAIAVFFICILNFDSSCKDCHFTSDRRQSLYCTHVCFYFVVLHDVKITWCISVKTAYSCPFISNYVTNLETKKRHKYFDLGLLEHILNQTVILLFSLTEVLCCT